MLNLDDQPSLALVVATMAVWRLTHLWQSEDGPWNVIANLRRLAGEGVLGTLLDCFYCLSVWIALPFAWWIGMTRSDQALLWPALSGAAILLERATQKPEPLPLTYLEDPEALDELLRQEPSIRIPTT